MIPNLLSIAGSDPSGGAGIQADLKTFGALGCFGMAALTALTVQNTRGVEGIHAVPTSFVAAQVAALFADIRIDAVKIGMLGSAQTAAAIADILASHQRLPVVLDPVLASTSGHALGDAAVADAITMRLAPLALLLTPNLGEAAILSGRPLATTFAEMEAAGNAILERGARAVLVKGGHLDGVQSVDILCTPAGCEHFAGRRIATRNTHGTGCTLSSAIAAYFARGLPIAEAIRCAKAYLETALAGADSLSVGIGHGPVDHFVALRQS